MAYIKLDVCAPEHQTCRVSSQPLTERQATVLAAIQSRQRTAGPTLREVAEMLKIAPNAVYRHVCALRESGHIAKECGDGLVIVKIPAP